ncbi:hypothetical protein BDD12DRAFT_822172 [Trichophaea hybrida]|nr:hypothetical protein BDD12DRAFT_822172 [Trichophaea hybrida]
MHCFSFFIEYTTVHRFLHGKCKPCHIAADFTITTSLDPLPYSRSLIECSHGFLNIHLANVQVNPIRPK